jgi:peptide deformylase
VFFYVVDMAETMYNTENGDEILLTGTGALAKCFCHEIDHLEGILFTDLVTEYIK